MSESQLVAIKIGNTNIGVGRFSGDRLEASWRIEALVRKTSDEYANDIFELFGSTSPVVSDVRNVAICSVVPSLTATFEELCSTYFHCAPFIVAPGVRSGLKILYDDPRSLGSDRLATMVAAKGQYGAPVLVVDVGTATTFNALNAAGDFVGGAIAPGPSIQAEALHRFTARLPRVEFAPPERALATNTIDAIRAGLFFGYVAMIEGMLTRLTRELAMPEILVIATGGLAPLVAPHCPSIRMVDTQLVYQGLRILYQMNRPIQ